MDGLRRDRTTRVVYAHMAVFGFWIYVFTPCIPLLRDDLGLTRGVAALHGTAVATGGVLSGLLAPLVVRRAGRGAMLRGGLLGICAGLTLVAIGHTLALTLLGALLAGVSGALCSNACSSSLSDHHGDAAAGALSESNAIAAGLGVIAPLIVGGFVAVGIGWRAGLLVALPATAIVLLYGRGARFPPARANRGPGIPTGRLPRPYWAAWAALVCCVGVEFSMTTWMSDMLRDRTGLDAGAATAAVTVLVAGLAIGRAVGTGLALRHPARRLLIIALTLNLAAFAGFWLTTDALVALPLLFLAGLGMALQFPLNLARAITASQGRPELAIARTALGTGLAIGAAPFALGSLADAIGTHTASLLVPALILVAFATLYRSPIST